MLAQNILKRTIAWKLPLKFRQDVLLQDLGKIKHTRWKIHPYAIIHGMSYVRFLRRASCRRPLVPTRQLKRCPNLARIILQFPCLRASLFNLPAGGCIARHRDHFNSKILRLHVPIVTNPAVYFLINQQRVVMRPGEVWGINADMEHEIYNLGKQDRVHLIMDIAPNTSIKDLFLKSRRVPYRRTKRGADAVRKRYLKLITAPSGSEKKRPTHLRTVAQMLDSLKG